MSKIITDLSCRVCLNVEELMIHIYEEVEDLNSDLSSLLELCGDLKVDKADCYPKYLCKECTSELLIAAKFREKCSKTKEILSQIEVDVESIQSNIYEKNVLLQTNYIPNHQLLKSIDKEFGVTYQTLNSSEGILYDNEQIKNEEPAGIVLYGEDDLGSDVIDVDTAVIHDFANDLTVETGRCGNKQYNVKALKYSCDICGAVFAYAQNLTRHFNKIHLPSHLHKCELCDHTFSFEEKFHEHLKNHKSAALDDIPDTETLIAKKRSKQKLMRKTCEYCNKECKSTFALNMHIRTHTGERPFSCGICDKSFKSNAALKGHIKRHTGVKDFNCSFCNKSFFEQNNLKTHMLTHTGEKPHTCTVCGKPFSRVFLLQLHMRTHTGEKPYDCPYCDRSFAQLCVAKNHIRTHTGERQFQCPACVKNFTKRKGLILHLQSIHSNLELTEGDEESSNTSFIVYEENSDLNIFDGNAKIEADEGIVDMSNGAIENSLSHMIVEEEEEGF